MPSGEIARTLPGALLTVPVTVLVAESKTINPFALPKYALVPAELKVSDSGCCGKAMAVPAVLVLVLIGTSGNAGVWPLQGLQVA